jgi:hypothetical protein
MQYSSADSAAAAGPNDAHARAAAAAAAKNDTPARVFANESSGFVGLFARMVWPIAAFAVYYIAMYSLRSASATATYFGEYAVLWSVQLGVLSSALGSSFRYMYLYQEPEWNKLFTQRAHEQVEMLAALADDIVYGSPERHLQSLVANSPSTYNLMLVNGCVASPISANARRTSACSSPPPTSPTGPRCSRGSSSRASARRPRSPSTAGWWTPRSA